MKSKIQNRIISLLLCISMILPMIAQPMPVYSVEADNADPRTAIGAVAEFKNTGNVILDIEPVSTGGKSVSVDLLPTHVVIKNYYYDEVNEKYWYQIDSAPGNKAWPTDYAEYHWAYADDLTIIAQNGMTSIFDANGNAVSAVTLPLYEKISLNAASSLQGSVKYQWQIEYESGKWVDIYGEDESEITLSIGLIATLLVDDSVNIRCVSTSASKTAASGAVMVVVDFSGIDGGEDPVEPDDTTKYSIEVQKNSCAVSELKIAERDYSFAVDLSAVTTLSGNVTYTWAMVNSKGTYTLTDLTAATITLSKMSHINSYLEKIDDSSVFTATLRVTATDGVNTVSTDVAIYVYENAVSDGVKIADGEYVDFVIIGDGVADTTVELTKTTSSVPFPEGETALLALDITLRDANGNEWQPAVGEEVTITVDAYRLGLSDGDYFAVYHVHDGETQLLGPYQVVNGYIIFEVKGFSEFVFSTNYGAAIGGVAEFAGSSVILDVSPVSFAGMTVWVEKLPAKIVIENYYFDNYLGKLFYEIDAAPGYTWPAEYADLHWCYSDALTNIDINGSMGMFDENGEPVSYVELDISDKPTYTVQTSLTGDVKYQWQICYDVNNYLWMDIDGQTDASIILSYALLASVLDENDMCAVRCIVSNALKTQEGYPMVIAFNDGSEEDAPIVENNANITVNGEETNSAELADKDYYWDSENGVEVTLENGILDLSVNTNLTGDDVTYQWQGLSGEEWVTLSTSKDYQLTFSDLMFAGAYSGSTAYIRVVVTQGDTVIESEPLTLTIVETEVSTYRYWWHTFGNRTRYAAPVRFASANSGIATAANETVTITVRFVNGQTGEPVGRTQDVFSIQYGSNFTAYGAGSDWQLPAVEGYSAYLGDDTETPLDDTWVLSRTNVTADETIIIKYWPAKVNYTVIYYWQNIDNDEYTEHERVTGQQFTGSEPVIDNKVYEGFYQLLYENVPCASDGSTVIEVYYDRLYFKMLFDLDGGYGVQPVYARYGTPVTVTNPTKAGYSFMGWNALNGPYNTSEEEGTADIVAFVDVTIPAMHTNYKAIWKATDAANVTVVIWGQKADNSDDLTDPNSYAYMSETEDGTDLTKLHFNAKPGTSVTYNPATGGYICGYTEEHTHGEGDCEATCGKTAHTHEENCSTLVCQISGHTEAEGHTDACLTCGGLQSHSISCYESSRGTLSTSAVTDYVTLYRLGYAEQTTGGLYRLRGLNSSSYYYKFGDQYYQVTDANDSTTVTLKANCGHTNLHDAHTDACYGCHIHSSSCYVPCSQEVHTHTAACYTGCTKEEHTHSSDCSLTIPMDSDLWEFDHASDVIVAADGSSTLNVYYRRKTFTITFHYNRNNGSYQSKSTITDRWGADIGKRFLAVNTAAKGNLWSEDSGGGDPWTSYLQIMPKRNIDYYCKYTSTKEQSAEYYTQKLDGTYELEYTVTAYYDSTLTISKEDFYEMEGFSYSHGTDGDGKTMSSPGKYGDFHGAKFYYTRMDYHLVFDNDGMPFKNELVLYEAPLSGYAADTYKVPDSLAPTRYQPGSVTFAGWYAAPQTPGDFNFDAVEPFDFANSKMPASDLKLYAWWKPVTHNVRFFYGEEYIELGQVYSATVDGTTITYNYNVPHGSTVQNPYSPPNDPTKGKYIFVGWFYRDDNGQEQMWDFANTTVTRDTDIYAKWSSNTLMPYEVKFMWNNPDTGEEIEIAAPITGSALGGNSKTFDAKGNADLYADYQTGYFPLVQSHTITIDLDDTNQNSFIFWYEKIAAVPYTVRYIDRATGQAVIGTDGKTYDAETYSDNKKIVVTETALMVPGYLPEEYQITLTVTPDGENVITFYYNKDAVNGMYVVHYWTENLDGTFSEHSVFNGKGVGSSTVSATIKDIENFTYIPGYNNATTGQKEVLSGQIAVGSVLELHVFYDRNTYPYKVQYMEDGTTKELADSKIVTGNLWENIVTENAITIPNYTLVSHAQLSIQIQKDTTDPTVNIITFYYEENKVTINYEVVGPDGCGTVTPESESVKISTGKANGSTAKPSSSVYKFVGWYDNAKCEGDALSTEATYIPTKEDGMLWNDGTTYFAKFEYNLTSLTIVKDGAEEYEDIDSNQSFIFDIYDGDTLVTTVTVNSTTGWRVVVDGLTVGKHYTVTEKTDWSWRYHCTGWKYTGSNATVTDAGNEASITLGLDGTITFTNTRGNEQWLDGDSWCNNIFSGPNS